MISRFVTEFQASLTEDSFRKLTLGKFRGESAAAPKLRQSLRRDSPKKINFILKKNLENYFDYIV